MFAGGRGLKGMFGEDPSQNTVVIQCRHDKQNFFARTIIKQRADAKSGREDGTNPDYIFYMRNATLDPATSRIDRGDLVFQLGKSIKNNGSALDNAIPVVSNLNGAFLRREEFSVDEINNNSIPHDVICQKLSENIRYIGVSLGDTTPASDDPSLRKEQITVRVQGTMDIFNNSKSNFVPGDLVLWEVPSMSDIADLPKRYGFSEYKVPLKLTPLRQAQKKYSVSHNVQKLLTNIGSKSVYASDDMQPEDSDGFKSLPLNKLARSLLQVMLMPILCTHKEIPEDFSMALLDDYADALILGKGCPENLNEEVFEVLERALSQCTKTRIFNTMLDNSLRAFFGVQEDVRRRTVGTSLEYCKPGQKFTVLLGQT